MSVYNERYNVVFIHVPKTAGTSMESVDFVGGGGHKTARQVRREIGEDVWLGAFKFAFVRDPLDRFASCYFHLMPQHKGTSFSGFVHRAARQGKVAYNKFTNHFSEQSFFICNSRGEVMVDFVGRFSELERDWAEVCRHVGVSAVLLHKRKGTHSSYGEFYTSELSALVRRIYKRDYELLSTFFDGSTKSERACPQSINST